MTIRTNIDLMNLLFEEASAPLRMGQYVVHNNEIGKIVRFGRTSDNAITYDLQMVDHSFNPAVPATSLRPAGQAELDAVRERFRPTMRPARVISRSRPR